MTPPRQKPDAECLFATAASQHGFFTASQASECGYATNLLTHHVRSGRFRRVHRGVYRLRDFPSSSHEDVAAAWLAVGRDSGVVSHESALALHELSDVVPAAIHLTVPRSRRYLPALPGVRLHTITRPPSANDVVERDGIQTTAPVRTILDAAESGVGPEQIEIAVGQAVRRGLLLPEQLSAAAQARSGRVRQLIARALSELGP
jgi:predicted transcriptional regulator of viral defense system